MDVVTFQMTDVARNLSRFESVLDYGTNTVICDSYSSLRGNALSYDAGKKHVHVHKMQRYRISICIPGFA